MIGRMKGSIGPVGVLGALLICLPCLLPVIAVFGGVAVFTTLGGFIADYALVAGLGAAGAIVSVAAAYIVWARRAHGAACELPDARAMSAIAARRQQR